MTLFQPALDTVAHKEACFRSDVGITGALFGIAETGSLALVFGGENPRLVSHAPFCHVALLRAKDILPDAETLFEKLSKRGISPSAMALVTGPSTTSDIALTPTKGIHGPEKFSSSSSIERGLYRLDISRRFRVIRPAALKLS